MNDFPTLTAADFAAAQSGPNAFILSTISPFWTPNLGPNSTAAWIGTGPTVDTSQNGALYAINFNWTAPSTAASLNITYSVDDQLGGSNNVGMFLDGNAIANSSSGVDWDGTIENHTFNLGTLSTGTHTLYFDVVNSGGGDSGLIFDGTVAATPEPAPFVVLGIGAMGIFMRRRKLA